MTRGPFGEIRGMRRILILCVLVLTLSLSISGIVLGEEAIDPSLLNRRASLMAPRGSYYRNIDYMSSEAPTDGTPMVKVGDDIYYYDRGIFWSQQGSLYVVVAAPVGAIVDTLPIASEKLPGRKDSIYYFFGAFFGEIGGMLEVIKPPVGAVVNYLPDGYKQQRVGNAISFRYDATCFAPVVAQRRLRYRVEECATETSISVATPAPMKGYAAPQDPNLNLALQAVTSASSTYCSGNGEHCYSPAKINDGRQSTKLGGFDSWANQGGPPQWVELEWRNPINISRVELYTTSGYEIGNYTIQYWTGKDWAPLANVTGNRATHRSHEFDTISTSRLRVLGNLGPSNQTSYVRVNELEVYESD